MTGFPKTLGARASGGRIYFPYVVVVVDLPLLRVAVEGSDNPVSLEKPCQALC